MQAWIIDAFVDETYGGNEAAIVICEHGFQRTAQMQAVARSVGLPTTAFVVPEACPDSYAVRWFTPKAELDICGHATVAAACFLYDVQGSRHSAELCFRTRSGPLHARRIGAEIALDLPRMDATDGAPPETLAQAIGARIVNFARAHDDILVELESEEAVACLRPNFESLAAIECRGHIVTARSERPDVDFVSRSFFPALGVDEDQVCVSAHCKLGPYWAQRLAKKRLIAIQLSKQGGRLVVDVTSRRVEVAGRARVRACVTCDRDTVDFAALAVPAAGMES